MADSKERLFSDFPPVSTQEWLDKITVDLKGADFEKKLVWRTNEGFNVQPFYRREDVLKLKTPDSLPGEFPFVRGNNKKDNTWYIRQNIAGTRVDNPIIAQKPFSEKIWRNDNLHLGAIYEVFNNCYAHVDFTFNRSRAYAPTSARIEGEDRGWNADGTSMELAGDALKDYYMNKFAPVWSQGTNFVVSMGLSFGF